MGDRPDAGGLVLLPRRNPKLAARVVKGEALLLTPHDSVLHTLNPVATRIWELLPAHQTVGTLAEALAEEFEVEQGTAQADLLDLLDELVERGILVPGAM